MQMQMQKHFCFKRFGKFEKVVPFGDFHLNKLKFWLIFYIKNVACQINSERLRWSERLHSQTAVEMC